MEFFDNTDNNSNPIQIEFNAGKLARNLMIICLCFEISFVVLDIFVNYLRWSDFKCMRRIFNIAREDSIASFFGIFQTLMVGITLWIIVFIQKKSQAPKKEIISWGVLALFFTYMAVDDGVQFHERLGTVFEVMFETIGPPRKMSPLGSHILHFFPSYPWQIVFLPFFGAIGLYILFFLRKQFESNNSIWLVILALSCFVVAVGLDFIEGMDKTHAWNFQTMIMDKYNLEKYPVNHFSKSIEEFLEMVGITLFWTSFVLHFKIILRKGICLKSG